MSYIGGIPKPATTYYDGTSKVPFTELFKIALETGIERALNDQIAITRLMHDKRELADELEESDREVGKHLARVKFLEGNAVSNQNIRDSLTGQVNALKEEMRRMKEENDFLKRDIQELTAPPVAAAEAKE